LDIDLWQVAPSKTILSWAAGLGATAAQLRSPEQADEINAHLFAFLRES
jgi:hypothetical protein